MYALKSEIFLNLQRPKKTYETQPQLPGKAWGNFKTTTAVLLPYMKGSIQNIEKHEVI